MNKYEVLFEEIEKGTRSGTIKWKQLRRTANADIVFNSNLVFRQFSAEFSRGKNDFTLLLLEKKYEDPEHDFVYEKYQLELLVVDAGELVVTLTESVIERQQLIRLVDTVERRSDRANKLFGASDA